MIGPPALHSEYFASADSAAGAAANGRKRRDGYRTMAEINLTQAEADDLLRVDKHRATDADFTFPRPGQSIAIGLKSADGREHFLLDIYKGRIRLKKVSMQTRVRQAVVLIRLDVAGAPHRNPDDTRIACPHLHLYREGFGDKWAFPVPSARFPCLDDEWRTLKHFMRYCNVVRPPRIHRSLLP